MVRSSQPLVALSLACAISTIACADADGNGDDGSTPTTQAPVSTAPASAPTQRWAFDDGDTLPPGIIPVVGEWKVEREGAAPSGPNVLRQKGRLAGATFPLAYVDGLALKDLTVRVRCRAEQGAEDQVCGLAFRMTDPQNYIITRANALEGNIRFYEVVGGARKQLASVTRAVTAGEWHTLEATAIGDAITVSWDGAVVLQSKHATSGAGSVALWTKADSITAFDDLEVVPR